MELKRETHQKVDEWVTRLTRALEDTQIEYERRRLQQELAFLEHVRDHRLDQMNRDDLEQLNERLSNRPAPEWVERSMHRA